MITTEVCVIGAGPGGCATAIKLAQLGIDCILVDKAVFPRHKACGEIITSNCIRELSYLDERILADYQDSDISYEIAGNTFVAPNLHELEVEYMSPENKRLGLPHCFASNRYDFDNFLVESIKKYYPQVRVIEGCHLNEFKVEDNHAFLYDKKGNLVSESKLVIFANGAGNALTKKTTKAKKRPNHEAIGVRAYYKNVLPNDHPTSVAESAEFYFFQKEYMPFGLYITPLPNGLVNINTWIRKDFVVRKQMNLRQIMDDFIKNHPKLAARFEHAELVGKVHGASLELGSRWWKVSNHHYMLVGDAAGLIDATNANGIGHAMISGQIAAQYAKQSLDAKDYSAKFLKAYDKALHKRMKNALKLSRMVSPFFSLPFFDSFSTWMINYWVRKKNDRQLLIKIIYSKNATRELLSPKTYYKMFFG